MHKKLIHFFNKPAFKNPFLTGSLVMIIGSNFANFINYIYHTLMGRILGPASYSELAVIFSLISLISIVTVSLGWVVTKFVSSAKDVSEIKHFVGWINKRIFLASLLFSFALIASSFFVTSFLSLSSSLPVILMALTFTFSFPALVNRAVLQGLLKFKDYTLTLVIEHSLKLVLGISFVILGLSVSGAFFGLLLAVLLTWGISKYLIRDFVGKGHNNFRDLKPLIFYTIPVFLQSLSMASINSIDLVLIKHFFNAYDAGLYAAASTLGKIIFFASGPVVAVMFPLISNKFVRGQNVHKIFLSSLGLTVLISSFIVLIFVLLPGLSIRLLYGSAYLEASNLLILFGIFMFFYTLAYLFVNFYLSIGQANIVILPIIGSTLQIIGILLFHSNLISVIYVSIAVTFLLLLSLIIVYSSKYLFKAW